MKTNNGIFRFRWSTFSGVLSFGILVPTFFIPLELGSKAHFLSIIVATITAFVIWEGSKLIQKIVTHYFPWDKSITQHLIYEILSIFVFSSLGLILGILIYSKIISSLQLTISLFLQNIFVSFSLALLFIAINEGRFLFGKWKESLVQQEKLKEENLRAKLESLKKQLDPHFLFNSLSVLSGIIYENPILADKFITQLSKVYRYVLDSQEASLIDIQKELTFVESYFFLLKVRFQQKIVLKNDLPIFEKQEKIAPLAIQLLLENAVKHNQALTENPLIIHLFVENNVLWVENNIQLRAEKIDSTHIGLNNLKDRYSYLTKIPIEIIQTNTIFKVGIPLIS